MNEGKTIPAKRLTKEDRQLIAETIIQPELSKRNADLKEEASALANAVFDASYTPKERSYIKEAPSGAFQTERINVSTQGYYIKLHVSKTIFARDRGRSFPIGSHEHQQLSERLIAFERSQQELEAWVKKEKAALIGALQSFTTWRALAEGWPELWASIKHLCPVETRSTALALPLADLNARFGLPRVGEGV